MSADFTPSVQTATITAGGTSEILVEASQIRSTLLIQPLTENCLINFGDVAGLQATGTLTVTTNPDALDTIDINGVTFTFVDADPEADEFLIGDDQTETAANMASQLNASADADIILATYSSDGAIVTITFNTGGVDGNSYALADSSGGDITRSAGTLEGGSDTVGGLLLQTNVQNIYDAVQFPAIKKDVYVVSASTSAKIAYLVGNGS